MRDFHVTPEVLDRFAHGDLDDGELSEVLRHLETCESCARNGQAHAVNDLAALRAELVAEPSVARLPVWSWALAAAVAIAVVSVLMIPKERPRDSARPLSVVSTAQTTPAEIPTPIPSKEIATYATRDWQRLVDQATLSGRLPFPSDLQTLHASPDTVRGGQGSLDRIRPAAVVIDEIRPEFIWPSRDGGTYVVSIFQDEREVMHSPPLNAPHWTPDRDLPRGQTLAWQVEVTRADVFETIPSPPSPPAMFRIVSETDHRDITRAKALHPDDHFLLAVLQARSGMRSEALSSLRRAAADNDVAKRILAHETSAAP